MELTTELTKIARMYPELELFSQRFLDSTDRTTVYFLTFLIRDYDLNTVCQDVCMEETYQCIILCDSNDSECVYSCLRAESTCYESKIFHIIVIH